MHLLTHPSGDGRVAVFGAGLIGSALLSRASAMGASLIARVPWAWSGDAMTCRNQNERARQWLAGEDRLDLVWSAGRAGFDAIVDLCVGLRAARPQRPLLLHLLSSAGGIHEGSGKVGPDKAIAPGRPYGELKLAQEALACSRLGRDGVAIYRPSAVFGWTRHGRRGLIMTLLANGLRYRVTTIIGRPESSRDFLWVRDLADWMMRGLRDPGRPGRCSILASGRPISMSEVLRAVEQTLGRRLYVQYRIDPREAPRLAYHPAVIAAGLHSQHLQVALRGMWVDAVGAARETAEGVNRVRSPVSRGDPLPSP